MVLHIFFSFEYLNNVTKLVQYIARLFLLCQHLRSLWRYICHAYWLRFCLLSLFFIFTMMAMKTKYKFSCIYFNSYHYHNGLVGIRLLKQQLFFFISSYFYIQICFPLWYLHGSSLLHWPIEPVDWANY